MKAIVYKQYGSPDVLELKDVEKPSPKDNELLIKIYATEATTGDCELRSFTFPLWFWLPLRIYMGITKPKRPIPGMYFSGEVEAIGENVKRFKVGDQIFGTCNMKLGAYAEYKCLPEKESLTIKPVDTTYTEAAAVPLGGCNALHFMRKANIQHGEKVLINGAGGSIGTFAVQLAKHYGAEVTAVDSTGKLDMLSSIGADYVIDYTKEDFTKNAERYDVIFEVVFKSSYSGCIKSLKHNGRYLIGNPGFLKMVRAFWTPMISNKKVIFEFASEKTDDLVDLKELIEAGKIKSVIDRSYPLEQTAEAHRYVETGRKKGAVVITIRHEDQV